MLVSTGLNRQTGLGNEAAEAVAEIPFSPVNSERNAMRPPIGSVLASLTVMSLIALTSLGQARAQGPDRGKRVTVAKGGVGESGATSLLHYKNEAKTQRLMVLRNVKSSLCGNTGAIAVLVVNGAPKVHGAITDANTSIQVKANPGDHVLTIVHAIPLFNNIACVRLGELEFELDECDLEK
jgi:hypothetical protein